jgi:hypothetical protein
MPNHSGHKRMTHQRGDLQNGLGVTTEIMWKDKRGVRILTNLHDASSEGNFCDKKRKDVKQLIVADYTRYICCVDKGVRMANCYCIKHRTWNWK